MIEQTSTESSYSVLHAQTPLRNELIPRVWWLIRFRYLAVAGTAAVICLAGFFSSRNPSQIASGADHAVAEFAGIITGAVNLTGQVIIWALLLLSNVIYQQIARNLDEETLDITPWSRLAYTQISIDFLILACQLHFAGGITNPFAIYFVFHTAFSGLLLTPRIAFVVTTWGIALYAGMAICEGAQLLHHYPLFAWVSPDKYRNPFAMATAILPLATAMYFMTYLTSSIAWTIGEKEDRRTDLQNDLKRRRDQLSETNRRLEKSMRERETFLLTVEHELKSPLAAIRSNLEAILVAGGELPELVRDMIYRSSQRTKDLVALVQDLLALSRVEREVDARIDETIDLAALVLDEIGLIRPLAEEKHLKLNVDVADGTKIRGSLTAARYCVANLLSNAVRYTEKGSVSVSLQNEDVGVVMEVCDTGIGIAKADQKRVFEEFYRTKAARRTVADGTGVGMTVVSRSLEALKGVIEVESEVGMGSIFRVMFPKI